MITLLAYDRPQMVQCNRNVYTYIQKIRTYTRSKNEKSEKNTYEGWHKQVRDREGEEKRSNSIMP